MRCNVEAVALLSSRTTPGNSIECLKIVSSHGCPRLGTAFLTPAIYSATDPELQQKVGNQPLTFRQYVAGNHLYFDGSGRPTNSSKAGTWTTDSQIRVQTIFLEKGVLRIEGHRSFFFLRPLDQPVRDMGELSPDDRAVVLFRHQSKDLHAWYESASKVKISPSTSRHPRPAGRHLCKPCADVRER